MLCVARPPVIFCFHTSLFLFESVNVYSFLRQYNGNRFWSALCVCVCVCVCVCGGGGGGGGVGGGGKGR